MSRPRCIRSQNATSAEVCLDCAPSHGAAREVAATLEARGLSVVIGFCRPHLRACQADSLLRSGSPWVLAST